MRSFRSIAVCVLAAFGVACGASQSSAPTSPSPTSPSSSLCRTFASGFSTHTVYEAYGIVQDSETTCTFDVAATTLTCATASSNGDRATTVAEYPSVERFVREGQVMPPLEFALRITRNGTGNQIPFLTTTERTFDDTGRLVAQVDRNGPPESRFGFTEFTYTSWDAFGRPLTATYLPGGNPPGGTRTMTYDDGARRKSLVDSLDGPGCSYTYDGSGIAIQETCENFFREVRRTTRAVSSVGQLCSPIIDMKP